MTELWHVLASGRILDSITLTAPWHLNFYGCIGNVNKLLGDSKLMCGILCAHSLTLSKSDVACPFIERKNSL